MIVTHLCECIALLHGSFESATASQDVVVGGNFEEDPRKDYHVTDDECGLYTKKWNRAHYSFPEL